MLFRSIANRAIALLDKTEARTRPVRLLGAGVHGLMDPADLDDDGWLPFG